MISKSEVWYVDQYIGHPKYGNVYRNFYMAKELVKRGYKVRVFSASYSHLMYSPPITTGLVTTEIIDDVEFNWIRVKRYGSGRGFGRIFSIFEFTAKVIMLKNLSPPDFVITPSVSFLPYWSIRYLISHVWKSKSPKLILEIRDLWPLTFTTVGNVRKANPFIRLLAKTEKHALTHVDYIISTLRMCQDYIDTIVNKPYRFKWIDNGINTPESSDFSLPAEIENLIPTDRFIVGYTGTLGAANSMEYFVNAAWLLVNQEAIHFVVVGDGYEKESLIARSRGLSNITFIPRVSKLLIPKILERFDVLYFSYLNAPELYQYGVSANKTYEYMLSGRPVILSCPLMKFNVITEAHCGKVIAPEDEHAIADAVNEMFGMSALQREELGRNGKKYILENNTFDILAEKLIEVFKELEADKSKAEIN